MAPYYVPLAKLKRCPIQTNSAPFASSRGATPTGAGPVLRSRPRPMVRRSFADVVSSLDSITDAADCNDGTDAGLVVDDLSRFGSAASNVGITEIPVGTENKLAVSLPVGDFDIADLLWDSDDRSDVLMKLELLSWLILFGIGL